MSLLGWAVGGLLSGGFSYFGKKKQADSAEELARLQIEENRRLEKILENAKIETLDDLKTTQSSILSDLNEFETEQVELILSTAEQLNVSVSEGLQLLNSQIQTAKESELNALTESGKLSMEALSEGYTNASGQIATSQQEILANLEEKQLISRNDIIAARDLAINEYDNQQSKLMEDMLVSGFITKEEAEAGAASSIGGLLGFSKRAIESLSPTSLAGRRALEQQKIWTGTATEQEISDFEANYGDPTDFTKSPLYQFQLQEQEEAITRMQKARGGFLSGAGAKELLEKGSQRLAAEESQRQYARLEGLRGAGQQADRDIASTIMETGRLGQDYVARKAENIGAIRTRAGEQLSGITQNYANLETDVMQRYGLTMAQLKQQFGTEKANLIANQAAQGNRVRSIYSGLSLQSQSDANTMRTGIAESRSNNQMNLNQNAASARQGVQQNMANLRKDTRLGTASQISNAGLAGSQLSNQLSLQAGNYRAEQKSMPFQGWAGITNIGASLYGMHNSLGKGVGSLGGTNPNFTDYYSGFRV